MLPILTSKEEVKRKDKFVDKSLNYLLKTKHEPFFKPNLNQNAHHLPYQSHVFVEKLNILLQFSRTYLPTHIK